MKAMDPAYRTRSANGEHRGRAEIHAAPETVPLHLQAYHPILEEIRFVQPHRLSGLQGNPR